MLVPVNIPVQRASVSTSEFGEDAGSGFATPQYLSEDHSHVFAGNSMSALPSGLHSRNSIDEAPELRHAAFRRPMEFVALEAKFNNIVQSQSDNQTNDYQIMLGEELCFLGNAGNLNSDTVKLDTVAVAEALPNSLSLVLLYFSGRWCPLCSKFDDALRDVYCGLKELDESGDIELVFVSCDVSEAAYRSHLQSLGSMLAVQWAPARLDEITRHFNVEGAPALLILDAVDGVVVTSTGREDIMEHHVPTNVPATAVSQPFLGRSDPMVVSLKFSWGQDQRQKTALFPADKRLDCGAATMLAHWMSLLEEKRERLRRAELFGHEST